jgi:2-deoxy-D-gluconate 3-dehydrogenase
MQAMNDLFSIKGKTALITGGSRGIGEMIAAGFLTNGAKVYISARKAEVCVETAARLTETYGGVCEALPADLSNMEGVTGLAAALAEREQSLDVLINNAGAAWGAPLEDFPEAGWDKVFDTRDQYRLDRRDQDAEVRQLFLLAVQGRGAPPDPRAGGASGG